jgi:hypothetical protein
VTALLGLLLLLPGQQTVRTSQELRAAVAEAAPGARILLAPGDYDGGLHLAEVRGAAGRPIVVAGADPARPPVFKGGTNGMQLSQVEHLELRDLVIREATGNGINIDDGGNRAVPSHDIVLHNLTILDIGAEGNQDGIKLSGVDDFRVQGCTLERWGTGGSGIDMVGCHRGVIEACTLRHDGSGGSGVQAKGGSAQVTIRKCRFERAGSRAVNIGGSTDLQYFRPPLAEPPHAEARAIVVEGCTFIGSEAPIAFVGVDGASVRFNTLYAPERWALRILQETTEPGFVACRRGEFAHNLVAFRSTQWSEGGVNVGPGTEPATFGFEGNWWYCVDDPARGRPRLPSAERGGTHGQDPRFRDAEQGDLRLQAGSPAQGVGAEALE